MTTSINQFLMAAGSASAKFEDVGDSITGTVMSAKVQQQTDIQDGKPLTWDNGDPRMQLVVTLKTTLREDEDDDGQRTLYVKGSTKAGSQSLHDAVRAAVVAANAKGLEEGGTLTVNFIGEEPSKTRGFNPRKLYSATYTKPDHAGASDGFLGATQPDPGPETAPHGGGADAADKARQLINLGLDDATIANATGLDASVVAILRTS